MPTGTLPAVATLPPSVQQEVRALGPSGGGRGNNAKSEGGGRKRERGRERGRGSVKAESEGEGDRGSACTAAYDSDA